MFAYANVAQADKINVSNLTELKAAIRDAKAGDDIRIEQGIYTGGFRKRNLQGTKDNPIVIEGKNPNTPPLFTGKGEAVKLSNAAYVKLRNLKFVGFLSNGINIDDGGDHDNSSHHIILEQITFKDIGPTGNNDAIKMSGVDHFLIKDCHIEGWGGSGADLVGCHQGVVQHSRFIGIAGYRTKNAIQIKGGSRDVLVQNSAFINCGERAINIGGQTGKKYFRPASVDYEVKNVIIAGNRFSGGETHVAWVTAQNAYVHHNIFYLPGKYVGRILQETTDTHYKPCQNGIFESNLVVTDKRVRTLVSVGAHTAPETFTFYRNAWYRPGSLGSPQLPTEEKEGIYGIYPDLLDSGGPDMQIGSNASALKNIGPNAYIPMKVKADFADIRIPNMTPLFPDLKK